MNNLLKTLAILTVAILISCKRQYTIEGNKVYYEYWNEGSGNNKWHLDSADAKTFTPLKFNCDCDFMFAKDKRHLFIDGVPIKNIDPNSFTFVGNYIFKDKDSAYFLGFYNNINNCVISGVNPNKIKLIRYPWARADNILIHGNDTIMLDDINSFVPIDEDWGKTKSKILNKNQILYGADLETFKIINSYSGKDKNYTYEFGKIKN
ncbi:MAG TPA: DKNYY domain-containing protein [Puia sp.]